MTPDGKAGQSPMEGQATRRTPSNKRITNTEKLQSANQELHTVNEEHRAEIEALAELSSDLKNLINSTDIATVFLDRQLGIRRFTPQIAGLFNLGADAVGRPLGDVILHLDYPELAADARRVMERLDKVRREARADDGRWFAVRIGPYRSVDDQIDGVVLTFSDISERKRTEIERETLLAEAQKANAAKSTFLGVLSHEFRTPLSGIIGYADLMAEGIGGEVTEKQQHYLGRIKLGANQLMRMVEEILEYARLESGKATVKLSKVELQPVVREVCDLVAPMAADKRLELRIELDETIPTLSTDAGKLRQILYNLIGNAVKFTERGHVTVRAKRSEAHVVIEVEDSGIGISPEDLSRIFDRFWQGNMTPGRMQTGTGLGLTVVRDLARLLGGDIAAESEPGRGARFVVSLPLVAAD